MFNVLVIEQTCFDCVKVFQTSVIFTDTLS